MARGEPLNDGDRWPWLDRLRAIIDDTLAGGGRLVLACSALKAQLPARLAGGAARSVRFVYLAGTPELLRARLATRPGHFMKPEMLDSQLSTLRGSGAPSRSTQLSRCPTYRVSARRPGRLIGRSPFWPRSCVDGSGRSSSPFTGKPVPWVPRLIGAGALVVGEAHRPGRDRIDRRQEPDVQVRHAGVAGVAAAADDVAAADPPADRQLHRVGRQVAELGVLGRRVLDDDVVPASLPFW